MAVAAAARVPGYASYLQSGWDKEKYHAECLWQSRLLRCMVGRLPFVPVALDKTWCTSTATQLAAAIYEERGFDRMPILADALEELAAPTSTS